MDRANYRNHRRILVADGRVGVTGGSGTSGKWSGNGRRKGSGATPTCGSKGPVVDQLQGAFAENWLEATGAALGGADYFPWPIEAKGAVDAQVGAQLAGGRQRGDVHHVPARDGLGPPRRSTSPIRTSCPTRR